MLFLMCYQRHPSSFLMVVQNVMVWHSKSRNCCHSSKWTLANTSITHILYPNCLTSHRLLGLVFFTRGSWILFAHQHLGDIAVISWILHVSFYGKQIWTKCRLCNWVSVVFLMYLHSILHNLGNGVAKQQIPTPIFFDTCCMITYLCCFLSVQKLKYCHLP